jgi:hypothetical protein
VGIAEFLLGRSLAISGDEQSRVLARPHALLRDAFRRIADFPAQQISLQPKNVPT